MHYRENENIYVYSAQTHIIYVLIFFIHIIDTIYMWIIVIFARYICIIIIRVSKTEEIVTCNKKRTANQNYGNYEEGITELRS